MRQPVHFVLFDCDGVLVASDASIRRCWTEWAKFYDVDADAVIAALSGRRAVDVISSFLPAQKFDEALAMAERLEIGDAGNTKAIPGAAAILSTIPSDRWAVVTSGKARLASARLSAAGLPTPAMLIAADDVSRGKPDPEGYLLGAKRCEFDLRYTAVVEDSVAGVEAALAAGVRTIIGVGRHVASRVETVVQDLQQLRWIDGQLVVRDYVTAS